MQQAEETFLKKVADDYRAKNFRHTVETTDFELPDNLDLARILEQRGIIKYASNRLCWLTRIGASLVMQQIPITTEGHAFMQSLRRVYGDDLEGFFQPDASEKTAAMEMQARGYVTLVSARDGWLLTDAGKEWVRNSEALRQVTY